MIYIHISCFSPHAAPCIDGSLSLLDYTAIPTTNREGILRICLNGTQGTVCDSEWGFEEASVACSALGFSPFGKLMLSV